MAPATPADLFACLDRLGLATRTVAHEPVFTVAESRAINSPLTKSLRSDSVPSESEREFGCGDGSAGRSSGRADGDVVRDPALTGPRVLRPPARGAARSRVRRLRGRSLPSVLRQDHGRTLGATRPLLPHAHGRVLRGDRQRARDRVALLGLILVTRVPPPGEPPAGSRSFVAVKDTRPSAP